MVLADYLAVSKPEDTWSRILRHMHAIFLRRLGKKRVVYLVRASSPEGGAREPSWHSNVNLVTGVSETWLKNDFSPGQAEHTCAVAGRV